MAVGEEKHFAQAVLPVVREAEQIKEPLFQTEFCIFLYGEEEEDVERDAQLLITSALKYGGMGRIDHAGEDGEV